MIQKFVQRFDVHRDDLLNQFKQRRPDDYVDIVRAVISVLGDEDDYGAPDPERVHEIDDGHYQGTLLFVIGAQGYQPSTYWAVKVGYGSCSGCDTLERIRGYDDDPITEVEAKSYLTLALHIVQGLVEIDGDEA